MKYLPLLLITITLSACSYEHGKIPKDSSVAISSEFTPEQMSSVLAAVDNWYAATGGEAVLRPHLGDDDGSPLTIRPGHLPGLRELGMTRVDADTAIMVLDVDQNAAGGYDLRHTVEHEIGHAYGLTHLDGTLMCASCPVPEIDPVTVQRFLDMYE